MITTDGEFETVWGWRPCEISETWRKHNEARKLEAGQSRKRITAGGSSGQTVNLNELKIREPAAVTPPSLIGPADDSDDSPHQPLPPMISKFSEDSDWRTLPSLKAVGLSDSFEAGTNNNPKSALPPLS